VFEIPLIIESVIFCNVETRSTTIMYQKHHVLTESICSTIVLSDCMFPVRFLGPVNVLALLDSERPIAIEVFASIVRYTKLLQVDPTFALSPASGSVTIRTR
jgi:hypothetical protein